VKQDRLPFLTYQRKLFLEDETVKPDKDVFVQILQDVSANRLPITTPEDVAQLAVAALFRALIGKKSALPTLTQLVEAGLFSYIPASMGALKTPAEWIQIATAFIEEHKLLSDPPKTEDWYMAKYVEIAKKQPLFWSLTLFCYSQRRRCGFRRRREFQRPQRLDKRRNAKVGRLDSVSGDAKDWRKRHVCLGRSQRRS